jgi:hypothetical protein
MTATHTLPLNLVQKSMDYIFRRITTTAPKRKTDHIELEFQSYEEISLGIR